MPLIVAEFGDGRGRRRTQTLDLHLGKAGVLPHLAGQLLAFIQDAAVKKLSNLGHGAIEIVLAQQLLALRSDPAGQVVEPRLLPTATTEEFTHGALR